MGDVTATAPSRGTAGDVRPGVLVPVPLRWADMDVYGHVNNTDVLRLLEQARVEGLPLVRDPATTGFLVVRHEVEYVRPIPYRSDGVVVRMWCTTTSAAGFDLGYEIEPPGDPTGDGGGSPPVYARAASTLVAFDFRADAPRRLSAGERETLGGIAGPPVRFRRSRAS